MTFKVYKIKEESVVVTTMDYGGRQRRRLSFEKLSLDILLPDVSLVKVVSLQTAYPSLVNTEDKC